MKWERINKQKVSTDESYLLYSEKSGIIGFGKYYPFGNENHQLPHYEYYTNDGKELNEISHFMRLPKPPKN